MPSNVDESLSMIVGAIVGAIVGSDRRVRFQKSIPFSSPRVYVTRYSAWIVNYSHRLHLYWHG